MWQCYYCRFVLSLDVQIKNRHCPSCGGDIHCCKNCVHFDENLSSKCKEPNSPWINDRVADNHCSFFEPTSSKYSHSGTDQSPEVISEAERAKEAFRALFRNA